MKRIIYKLSIYIFSFILLTTAMSGCVVKKEGEVREFIPDYESYNTYVFFGVDSRADDSSWKDGDDKTGTEGAPSSDVIMLIRIDEENGDVKVTSVYRDTMLDVTGEGDLDKCNAAYRIGDAYGAIAMLENDLDLKITGYASANFIAVADAIDILGGVTVDVKKEKVQDVYRESGDNSIDVINKLIDELNKVYDRKSPHIKGPGKQTLDGIQAVAYSRQRYTEGSDMARSMRQRDIFTLMVQKLKKADTKTQHKVLKEMYPTIDTDMNEADLMSLFDTLIGFDLGDMEGFPYYKKAKLHKKFWYLVPTDLVSNVTELHKRMYGEEDYAPTGDVIEVNDEIIEETGLTKDDVDEKISDKY